MMNFNCLKRRSKAAFGQAGLLKNKYDFGGQPTDVNTVLMEQKKLSYEILRRYHQKDDEIIEFKNQK